MNAAQAADTERMRQSIELGVAPFYDGNGFAKSHHRRPDGKCAADKCHEPWPCKAVLRQLHAHGGA